eukprot:TRINITY_DN34897_c0_g1_i1.p1 TRINITY_DN34897_c0_g1~~TRINITY_DN34897_c0_g1_i1.p1  ORF type:complete len:123 (+),score=60.43 TRINITY_DN34897_c0_g1_i1:142-510(+)
MGKDKKGPAKPSGKDDKKNKNDKTGAGGGIDSMEVRHILLEKHGKALEVLKVIDDGKMTFNEAAREHSLDKAGRSGLLGWKRKTELDPDFWEAALKLDVGEHSKEPVKTPFGYHIILVQARK